VLFEALATGSNNGKYVAVWGFGKLWLAHLEFEYSNKNKNCQECTDPVHSISRFQAVRLLRFTLGVKATEGRLPVLRTLLATSRLEIFVFIRCILGNLLRLSSVFLFFGLPILFIAQEHQFVELVREAFDKGFDALHGLAGGTVAERLVEAGFKVEETLVDDSHFVDG
jgi:hypothetical protein